jgi:hypothetical protein
MAERARLKKDLLRLVSPRFRNSQFVDYLLRRRSTASSSTGRATGQRQGRLRDPPHDDVQGVLFLAAGPDVVGVLLVKARMEVIQHPVHVVGPTTTPAFTEYRLLEAVRASR